MVGFLVESLVALGGVDGEVSELFACQGDDAHVAVGDVETYFCAGVFAADDDVAEQCSVA